MSGDFSTSAKQRSIALILTAFVTGRINKVECIKAIREITYLGLKESKELVDEHETHMKALFCAYGGIE